MLTRSQKAKIIDNLADEFKSAGAVVICGFKGITHKQLEALRVYADQNDTRVRVVKNSFVTLAAQKAKIDKIDVTDNNLAIWSSDQISACKVADKFASDNKDKFVIKAGYLEGKVADVATINAMAKLPSHEELLGMLLSVWTAPARNFVTGLDNLRAKLENEAA